MKVMIPVQKWIWKNFSTVWHHGHNPGTGIRMEGTDDSPSHLKTLITPISLSIPVDDGQLSLGTWQGIYLIEHRDHSQDRRILVRCLSV